MKAIVLSCDNYHALTHHMIQSYEEFWPSHPFVFRVPYQHYPQDLKKLHGRKIELIHSPVEIKKTVLRLIDDLPDDEWVYWCVDDKYPVAIDEFAANDCYNWISGIDDSKICGALFCRCRKLMDPDNLYNITIKTPRGNHYLERKNYYQFWIHQFLRVKVLRGLFLDFPDVPFKAKEMDTFTGQIPGMEIKPLNKQQKMYVSRNNFARFGESTLAGQITQNCFASMTSRGLAIPDHLTVTSESSLMGKM